MASAEFRSMIFSSFLIFNVFMGSNYESANPIFAIFSQLKKKKNFLNKDVFFDGRKKYHIKYWWKQESEIRCVIRWPRQ